MTSNLAVLEGRGATMGAERGGRKLTSEISEDPTSNRPCAIGMTLGQAFSQRNDEPSGHSQQKAGLSVGSEVGTKSPML